MAHPAVASAQNTPATMWPPVKREMRLISPAEPDEGMPMNLGFCQVNQRSYAMRCDEGSLGDLHVGAEGDVECAEQEERVEKEAVPARHVTRLIARHNAGEDKRSTHSFA